MSHPTQTPGSGRFLPLSGVAFAVLMVAAAIGFPMPPGGDTSPATVPGWLAAHTGAVIAQSYVRALAAVAFLALTAAVAAACRRASSSPSALPGLALAGGACTGGLLLLGQGVTLAAALQARNGGGVAAIRALGALQNGFLDMSSLPATLLFGAVGLAALRTRLLPRWLAVVTLLGVPFAVADAASYDGGPLESVGLAGLVYFLLWSLVTGVLLATRRHEPSSIAEPLATMSFS
jgi:hypothetical protein